MENSRAPGFRIFVTVIRVYGTRSCSAKIRTLDRKNILLKAHEITKGGVFCNVAWENCAFQIDSERIQAYLSEVQLFELILDHVLFLKYSGLPKEIDNLVRISSPRNA